MTGLSPGDAMPVNAKDECPAGCGRPQPIATRFLCTDCWREVPRHLQRAVNAAWRARLADPFDKGRRDAHEHAKAAALASIA